MTMANVFVHTDASFSFQTKKGAWAACISGELRAEQSGPCPEDVNDPSAAELYAMLRALELIVEKLPSAQGKHVRFHSDSQLALLWITQGRKKCRTNECVAGLQSQIRKILHQHGITVQTHWVRGHQRVAKDKTSRLNHRCDFMARTKREQMENGHEHDQDQDQALR